MSASQSIRDIFFEECEDLVDALLDGLAAMVDGATDAETVNAVFRAVHSIKGGAGAFGLERLVGFSHSFETLLDKLRDGTIAPQQNLLNTLQKAGDILSDLVETERDEIDREIPAADAMLVTLKELLGEESADSEDDELELDFQPMGLDFGLGDEASEDSYSITFTPYRDLYEIGHEPLALLRALAELGSLSVETDTSALPEFVVLDHEIPHLSWSLKLETSEPREKITEIFEFVEGLCDLEISQEAPLTEFPEIPEVPETDAPVEHITPPKEPEPEAEQKSNKTAPAKREVRDTLRVDVERIDRLINLVGELIVNQAMISQRFIELQVDDGSDVLTDLDDYKQLARDIQEGVMSLRTQPVRPLFQRMSRIVREAADGVGKSVQLVTDGEWTEVDKKVTEKLSDPLTHMIRNSIDHGIETPEKRQEAGKDPKGTVWLSAMHKSGNVLIEIRDDGAGLNRQRILEIAIDKELVSADAVLSNAEIDELLFLPGFSTAKEVTNLSGRGVGMDVVRTAIGALGGRIGISSTPGEGTTFSIQLPLTLAVLDGMAVEIGTQTLIIPISSILEAIRPSDQDLKEVRPGRVVLKYRDAFLPVIDLATRLNLPASQSELKDQVLLIVSANNRLVAFSVDAVKDQRQVVIKSLTGNYGHIKGISAATILGDGNVALIVDPDGVEDDIGTLSLEGETIQSQPSKGEDA